MIESKDKNKLPAGWIEQPTSSLRVTRSTTELSGLYMKSPTLTFLVVLLWLTAHSHVSKTLICQRIPTNP